MRLLSILLILFCLAPAAFSQSEDELVGWFIDDFESTTFDTRWNEVSGNWGLDQKNVVAKLASGDAALTNEIYVMRTKPYLIDMMVEGAGGGVLFCLENHAELREGHVVYFTGSSLTMGYFDHVGTYVETRRISYAMPERKAVQLKVQVDPVKRRYTVTIFKRDVALEELRYRSGYFGVYSNQSNAKFDYFQVLGYEEPDSPTLFLKSNTTQLDHVSYITALGDALLVSNPIVGVVQRITGRGSFVNEYFVQGLNSHPRGSFVNDKRWVYIVDGGQNSVRVYNENEQMELMFSEGMEDPRAITTDASGSVIYVLDINAIHLYDRKGNQTGSKAVGQFKDPKNMWQANGNLYVADHGNARVVILDLATLEVKDEIKEEIVAPYDVFVEEATGDIYVADPGAMAVLRFDKNKSLVERFDPITIRGFISPRSVRVINEFIYVADFERILAFKKGVLSVRPTFKIEF
jgi:hypothetical protein